MSALVKASLSGGGTMDRQELKSIPIKSAIARAARPAEIGRSEDRNNKQLGACLVCSAPVRRPSCPRCLVRLSSPETLCPEQIEAQPTTVAGAFLLDFWARPHGIAPITIVSRGPHIEPLAGRVLLSVANRDVSRLHAELTLRENTWYLRDRGSRNGTFLDDQPISSARRLSHGSIVRFGSVSFYFVLANLTQADTEVLRARAEAAYGTRQAPLTVSEPARERRAALVLVQSAQGWRSSVRAGEQQVAVTPLQSNLLRVLASAGPDDMWVPGSHLLADLPWSSSDPSYSQLSGLVQRLNAKLESVAHRPVVVHKRGWGFRVSPEISVQVP